jgi:pilus assembly protein Flp/PilA
MIRYEFFKVWFDAHRNERGASLVEYALLVALIAVACIAAMQFLQGGVDDQFSSAANEL